MELSERASDPLLKDRHAGEAFDSLFHAAKMASMAYLSTDVGRWGLVRKRLPEPYKTKFNDFIITLHIKYFYNGEYPKERAKEEFNLWLKKVKEYVNELEAKIKKA